MDDGCVTISWSQVEPEEVPRSEPTGLDACRVSHINVYKLSDEPQVDVHLGSAAPVLPVW